MTHALTDLCGKVALDRFAVALFIQLDRGKGHFHVRQRLLDPLAERAPAAANNAVSLRPNVTQPDLFENTTTEFLAIRSSTVSPVLPLTCLVSDAVSETDDR